MIPAGYKKTEIGVIPQEWEIVTWGDVAKGFTSGATPFRGNRDNFKGVINWVTSGELNYNIINKTNEHISGDAKRKTNLTLHPAGTFLMAITGLEAEGTRGSCAILGVPATTNQSCMAIYESNKLDISFLFYYYIKYGNELALKYCQGTKQQSYTAKIVKQLPLILPPIREQQGIAEALSDVDKLITSLEKQIEKKKAIKQGVMQELLTGKRRLPGFTGEWITSNQLFKVVKGEQINGSELQEDLPYPLYNGGVSASGYTSDYNYENRVIISEGGNSCGYINYIKTKFWAGGHCYVVVNAKVLNDYLYQLLKLHETNIMALRVGSGLPNIQKEELKKFRFSYPKETEEQQAIVKVLYDIDLGIRRLTDKLDKVHKIKSGMMSELLTGRIRLV